MELAVGPPTGVGGQADGRMVMVGCDHHPGRVTPRHRGQFGRRNLRRQRGSGRNDWTRSTVPRNELCKYHDLRQYDRAREQWIEWCHGSKPVWRWLDQLGGFLFASIKYRSGQRSWRRAWFRRYGRWQYFGPRPKQLGYDSGETN